jgi:hypothetical protein
MKSETPRRPRHAPFEVEALEQRLTMSAGAFTALSARRPAVAGLAPAAFRHSVSALSRAADTLAATAVAGKAIFAGGEAGPYLGGTPVGSNVIDIYDPATGVWSTAAMSTSRVGGAAVSVDNESVFAGGDFGAAFTGLADVYNASTGQSHISRPPYSTLDPASAAAAGKAVFVGGAAAPDGAARVFDAGTGAWSTSVLPIPITRSFSGLVVGAGAFFPNFPSALEVYDAVAGQWSLTTVPADLGGSGSLNIATAASIGTRLVFSTTDGARIVTFDSITGTWATSGVPDRLVRCLRDDAFPPAVSVVGTKVLYASQNGGNASVAVYNTATGRWSATRLSQSRQFLAPTSVGRQALFAGGDASASDNSDVATVDIFTDLAPTPVVTGYLTGRAGGTVSVTLYNTGDATLPAGGTLGVYASAGRTLRHAIPLGRFNLSDPLGAGASVQISVPTNVPTNLPKGDYHLLAALQEGHKLTPIAATAETFSVA